ncbi:MAG: ABA4-like family protein [Pseudomonadota bacterium]
MPLETLFSIAGLTAMIGWLALLVSPYMPVWSNRIAGWLIPSVLAAGYVTLALSHPPAQGGFDTLASVAELFAQPAVLLAGWVHFLAFDLVVGAWICRSARSAHVPFWMVLPCLPLTFLFGPAGFALYAGIRAARRT